MAFPARPLACLVLLVATPGAAAEDALSGCRARDGVPTEQSLERCAEVRARAAAAGDVKLEVDALQATADLLMAVGRQDDALARLQEVLALRRQLRDPRGQAEALADMGVIFLELGRPEQGLTCSEQALALRREVGDRAGEASVLSDIGVAHSHRGSYQKSLQFYEQALAVQRSIGDKAGEAMTLSNIGADYNKLGQYPEGLERLEAALALQREAGATRAQSRTLNNIAFAEKESGQLERAVEHYQEALALNREVHDRFGEAILLSNLGATYGALDQPLRAVEFLEQAVAAQREVQNRRGEARSLYSLGVAHAALAQWTQALGEYRQALVIQAEVSDRDGSSRTLASLVTASRAAGGPALAIFFGKAAVNAVQEIRGEIQTLPPELRRGFLRTRVGLYRELGDLLLDAGRLPEAQQVLGLAKEEEFGSFLRGGGPPQVDLVNLTPREAREARRLKELAQSTAALNRELAPLQDRKQRTPAEEQRLAEEQVQLAQARQDLSTFLAGLEESFAAHPSSPRPDDDPPQMQRLELDLGRRGAGTAVLYTLVLPDRYRVLVVTAQGQIARERPIARSALAQKVLAFREALQTPASDPVPLARELYEILVGPIAQDLKAAQADTLLWSLDGALRYLPVAALHDGTGYLVERFRTGVVTRGSLAGPRRPPQRPWTAWGFGVSRAASGFPPLPGVREELGEIVRTPQTKQGALLGDVRLDEAFTWKAMRAALESGRHRPVVHIASHFQFQPGVAAASFLLLGDGQRLTLEQLAERPHLFEGVEVLSLSACDTAVETGEESGREVEGFAMLAQRQGAGAVLATLWAVQDESARRVMAQFYRQREAHPERTKAEALRQAQLALWTTPVGAASRPTARSAAPAARPGDQDRAPRAYSHPYYWAPFVLLGDWL